MIKKNIIIKFVTDVYQNVVKGGKKKQVKVFSEGDIWFVDNKVEKLNPPTGQTHVIVTIDNLCVIENERTGNKHVGSSHYKDIREKFLIQCLDAGFAVIEHEDAPRMKDDQVFYDRLMGLEKATSSAGKIADEAAGAIMDILKDDGVSHEGIKDIILEAVAKYTKTT